MSEYHDSQDLIVRAEAARRDGRLDEARSLFGAAAQLQAQMVDSLPLDRVKTRSVFGVSAASLFHKAGAGDEAEKLAYGLLSQNWLQDQSRAALEQLLGRIWTERRMASEGLDASGEPLSFTLSGNAIWQKDKQQQPAAPDPAPAPLAAQVRQEVAERGPLPEEWQEEAAELFAGAPDLEVGEDFYADAVADQGFTVIEAGPSLDVTAERLAGVYRTPEHTADSAAEGGDSVAEVAPPTTDAPAPALGLYAPGQPDSPYAWKWFWAAGWAEWLAGESGRALTASEAAKTISFLAGVTVTQKSVKSQRERMRKAVTLPPATAKGGRRKPAPTDDERRAAAEKLPEVPVPAAPSDVPIVTYLPSGRVNWVPLAPWLLANAELGATELARLLSAKAEKPIPPKNVQMTISYLRHRDDDPQDREPAAPKPLPPEPPVVIAGGDGNGEEEPNAGAVLAEMLENPPSTLCRPVHPGAVPARRVPVVTTPRPAPAPPAPVDRGEWHDTDDAALEASLGRICDEKCDLTGKPRLYVLGRMIVALVGELR